MCSRSRKFNKYICCSSTGPQGGLLLVSFARPAALCPGGETPLSDPEECSASTPCPTGYVCKNSRCCPSTGERLPRVLHSANQKHSNGLISHSSLLSEHRKKRRRRLVLMFAEAIGPVSHVEACSIVDLPKIGFATRLAGVCPAGHPLGGGPMSCSAEEPCQKGYECVTTAGAQYCCPSKGILSSTYKPALTPAYSQCGRTRQL